MTRRILATHRLGDMCVAYVTDGDTGVVGMWMWPAVLESALVGLSRRQALTELEIAGLGVPLPAWQVDSLVHVHRRGDGAATGYAQGMTMRNSATTRALRLRDQHVERGAEGVTVRTEVDELGGLRCTHILNHRPGEPFVRLHTAVENCSDSSCTLEMISSFSLGGLSPFARDDAPDRYRVHRFRSVWAGEGRHVAENLYDLHLERTWAGICHNALRFGQVGSLPVRGFFPAACIEDREAGVMWGAVLACNGSWQMEVARTDDCLNLSGGPADYEFGHWAKTLAPGDVFETPEAVLTCAAAGIDMVMQRLTAAQVGAAESQPAIESDLPICFNEWCTTWGSPSHQNVVALADRLQESGVTYLVIDAGWMVGKDNNPNWMVTPGDWTVNAERFPDGLRATADAIRERGLVPGLWFEMEVAAGGSAAYNEHVEHMLHRHGRPVTVGTRRFWDLRLQQAHDYLDRRVIDQLEEAGFGYLKVDYNETIGLGADGAESPGEALRQHLQGTTELFRRIRRRMPGLVIENCASGGYRLEPSMQALAALGSFSDAHEGREIPIIAANLHRLILPRQSLVWAVLRKHDDEQRLVYSLAATFLGRMCLSGDALDLSDEQWAVVRRAIDLYRRVAPVIRSGRSQVIGTPQASYRHPRGFQAVLRLNPEQDQALAVVHAFDQPGTDSAALLLPEGDWRIAEKLVAGTGAAVVEGRRLVCPVAGSFTGQVVWLKRR